MWTTRLSGPTRPAQIAITGAAGTDEYRTLAAATQTQPPLPVARSADDRTRSMSPAGTAPEADLTGWTVEPFTAAGYTHDVYRKGEGPGVVLIPEMPGIHPGVLALGNHLVDNGFTVACPSLFGTPGAAGRCGRVPFR